MNPPFEVVPFSEAIWLGGSTIKIRVNVLEKSEESYFSQLAENSNRERVTNLTLDFWGEMIKLISGTTTPCY